MSQLNLIWKILGTAIIVLSINGAVFAHEGEVHNDEKEKPALSAQGKRIVDTLENYATAVKSGNIAEIEKYVITGDGFSSLEGTFQDLGWDSYRKHLAAELPLFHDTEYSLSNIRPYVRGDLAYATTEYIMNVTIKSDQFEGGEHKVAMKGKATIVLSKSKNEWKIRHIHTSREEPENAQEENGSH